MHRWLRPARRDTAVSHSILDHVGHSQRETEMRGECIDNHASDDSDEAFLSIRLSLPPAEKLKLVLKSAYPVLA